MIKKLMALSILTLNVFHVSFAMDPIPGNGFSQLSRMRVFQDTKSKKHPLYIVTEIGRKKENIYQLQTESIIDSSIKTIHLTHVAKLLHLYNAVANEIGPYTYKNDNRIDLVYLKCIAPDQSKSYLQTSYRRLHNFVFFYTKRQNTLMISSTDTQAALVSIHDADLPVTEMRNRVILSEDDTKKVMLLLQEAQEQNMACVLECEESVYNILHVTKDGVYSYLLPQPEVDQLQIASQNTAATLISTQNNSLLLQQPSLLSFIGSSLGTGLRQIGASLHPGSTIHTLSAVGMSVPIIICIAHHYGSPILVSLIGTRAIMAMGKIAVGSTVIATAIHLSYAGRALYGLCFQSQK